MAQTLANNYKSDCTTFKKGVIIWGIATIFYFFDNLLNVSPSGMAKELQLSFSISKAELGLLSSCYLWPYGLMQIPAGLMMDTIGPRRLLSVASLSCSLGALMFGISDSFAVACIGRGFIGIGASFAVVGCSKIASIWFDSKRFALFMGLMVSVGMLGGAFGVATVSQIISNLGWRESMIFGSVISLVLAGSLYAVVKDDGPNTVNMAPVSELPIILSLKKVLASKQAWLSAFYAGFMFVPTLAFGALWGTQFLAEAHNFSSDDAGYLTSLVFIGWVFGGPIYGYISDKIGRRNLPMYFANITTLIVSCMLILSDSLSIMEVGILMFALGFFSSGFILAFAVTRENNPPEISGTAVGFINMINTFSVALFQWLIGAVLDYVFAKSPNITITLADYKTALMCIPICLVISLIMLTPIKETYCKQS